MTTKAATTSIPIHDIIARRWSPRAFDAERSVSSGQITSLLEAARWAPSCFGDEPWRFVICNKSTNETAWQQALECLAPKNQEWAVNAPVLILACTDSLFRQNGKPNRWAQYDTGAAAISLCMQAVDLGLAAHQMGGFDPDAARSAFNIPEQFTPMAMIAVGHQADANILDEDFKAAELVERKRWPLPENCFDGEWNKSVT